MEQGKRRRRGRRAGPADGLVFQPLGRRVAERSLTIGRRAGLSRWQVVLLLAVGGLALILASSLAPRFARARRSSSDLAKAAREYLVERNVEPLKADLDQILAKAASDAKPSLSHPLLSH